MELMGGRADGAEEAGVGFEDFRAVMEPRDSDDLVENLEEVLARWGKLKAGPPPRALSRLFCFFLLCACDYQALARFEMRRTRLCHCAHGRGISRVFSWPSPKDVRSD